MSHGAYRAELASAFADSLDREQRVIERIGNETRTRSILTGHFRAQQRTIPQDCEAIDIVRGLIHASIIFARTISQGRGLING
jgi:hypothetical protein